MRLRKQEALGRKYTTAIQCSKEEGTEGRKEGSIYEISAIPSASVVVLLRSGVKGHEVETGKVGRQIK